MVYRTCNEKYLHFTYIAHNNEVHITHYIHIYSFMLCIKHGSYFAANYPQCILYSNVLSLCGEQAHAAAHILVHKFHALPVYMNPFECNIRNVYMYEHFIFISRAANILHFLFSAYKMETCISKQHPTKKKKML